MPVRRKSSEVDQLINRIKEQKIAEFGDVDLPLAVVVLARNRAAQEGITSRQALDAIISEEGSLDVVIKGARRIARRIRRKRARAGSGGSAKGVFGMTTLLPGAPPFQGGAPGSGKSSRRSR